MDGERLRSLRGGKTKTGDILRGRETRTERERWTGKGTQTGTMGEETMDIEANAGIRTETDAETWTEMTGEGRQTEGKTRSGTAGTEETDDKQRTETEVFVFFTC